MNSSVQPKSFQTALQKLSGPSKKYIIYSPILWAFYSITMNLPPTRCWRTSDGTNVVLLPGHSEPPPESRGSSSESRGTPTAWALLTQVSWQWGNVVGREGRTERVAGQGGGRDGWSKSEKWFLVAAMCTRSYPLPIFQSALLPFSPQSYISYKATMDPGRATGHWEANTEIRMQRHHWTGCHRMTPLDAVQAPSAWLHLHQWLWFWICSSQSTWARAFVLLSKLIIKFMPVTCTLTRCLC